MIQIETQENHPNHPRTTAPGVASAPRQPECHCQLKCHLGRHQYEMRRLTYGHLNSSPVYLGHTQSLPRLQPHWQNQEQEMPLRRRNRQGRPPPQEYVGSETGCHVEAAAAHVEG